MDFKKLFGIGSSSASPPPPATKATADPAAASTIIGQWKEPSGSETTEFRADGTVVEKPPGGEMIRGQYSLEGARLKVRLDGVKEELVFTCAIKNDILEMTDSEGKTTKYGRAEP